MRAFVLAVLLATSAARFVSAQVSTAAPAEVDTQTAERARELGLAGLRAYEESRFEAALDSFQKAEALAHSPVFELYMARCLLGLERPDEARAWLEKVAALEASDRAPEAWRRAREEARTLLDATPESNAAPESKTLPESETPRSEPPVEALPPSAAEPKETPPHAIPPPPASVPPPRQNFWQRATPLHRGAYVAFGVGAAGLVFAGIAGTWAVVLASDVRAHCEDGVCPPEQEPRAQEAIELANLATIGLVVLAAGGVTGTVLWVWPDKKQRAGVQLGLTAAGLRLSGSF